MLCSWGGNRRPGGKKWQPIAGCMTYGHLWADCLYTGISSGLNARCRVWEAFSNFILLSKNIKLFWSTNTGCAGCCIILANIAQLVPGKICLSVSSPAMSTLSVSSPSMSSEVKWVVKWVGFNVPLNGNRTLRTQDTSVPRHFGTKTFRH